MASEAERDMLHFSPMGACLLYTFQMYEKKKKMLAKTSPAECLEQKRSSKREGEKAQSFSKEEPEQMWDGHRHVCAYPIYFQHRADEPGFCGDAACARRKAQEEACGGAEKAEGVGGGTGWCFLPCDNRIQTTTTPKHSVSQYQH